MPNPDTRFRFRLLLAALFCALLLSAAPALAAGAQPGVSDFDVAAKAAILIDADTGQVLFAKNADEQRQPASITKLMTLELALEAVDSGRASLDETVTVSHHAWEMGGSQLYLATGAKYSLEKMIEGVAVASANDAAMAVAEHLAGTEPTFVQMMNQRAKQLGMTQTHYTNPTGLPPDKGEQPDLTTARDIATLARTLITQHPEILKWTSQQELVFSKDPSIIRFNTNKLLGKYAGMDGLKTGETDAAGWCLVGTAKRGDIRLISVILGANSDQGRDEQTARLLDYGFNRYGLVQVVDAGKVAGTITLRNGSPATFNVVAPAGLHILLEKGANTTIQRRVVPAANLALPIKKGAVVGTVEAVVGGNAVLSTPVVAATDVQRANFFVRFFRWIGSLFSGLFH